LMGVAIATSARATFGESVSCALIRMRATESR
jgi:hypothetical protein